MSHRVVLVLLVSVFVASAQDAQEQMSDEVKQLLQSARQKAQQRDFQGALDEVSKALELDPKRAAIWFLSARLKGALNDQQGLIADLTEALTLDDDIRGGYLLRAQARWRLKDYDGAAKDYGQAISKDARDANAYWGRGQVRELMGDLDGALKDFSSVCSVSAEFGRAYLKRADLYAAQGDFKKAMEDYENAMFLMEGQQLTDVLTSRGRTKLLRGDVEGAKKDYRSAVESAPESHQVLFSRGLLHHDMAMYKEAVADFRKSLELDAKAHEYGRLYICLSRMRLGEKDAAQKELGTHLDEREEKDDWFVKVAGFLAGRITEKEFLDAAQDENKYTTREQSCEAYWYIGARALSDGDKAKGTQYLNLCVAIKVHNFIEYQSSQVILKRLAKESGGAEK